MPTVDELVEEFHHRRPGVKCVVRAESAEQAVDIAWRLQQVGEAQWFRGQIQDWPKLAPTYARLPKEEMPAAQERIQRFGYWVKNTPGLEALAKDSDQMIAVGQHYGLATTFLDFTTDPLVAGFFATDGDAPPPGIQSCIVCLNLEEARTLWDDVRGYRADRIPVLLVLDVPNLWRLEAQRGVFVHCPYDTLDAPYPLARIVFPYSGPMVGVNREAIYPDRESPLEAMLREYFQEEAIRRGYPAFEELTRRIGAHTFEFDSRLFRPEVFASEPKRHSSWDPLRIAGWLAVKRERWETAALGRQVELELSEDEPRRVREAIRRQILGLLDANPSFRSSFPRWVAGSASAAGLSGMLQRVWDGMVRLPFEPGDIALAMGSTAAFAIAYKQTRNEKSAAAALLREPYRVELGGRGENVHSFAWAAEEDLRAAVRDDFEELLLPDKRDLVLGMTFNVLRVVRSPQLLFDFDRLTNLFVHQLIPTQAALDAGNPTFFTPARLSVIGPP